MLSHKQGRGASALKRIRCYDGLPKEFADSKLEPIHQAKGIVTITLETISEELR